MMLELGISHSRLRSYECVNAQLVVMLDFGALAALITVGGVIERDNRENANGSVLPMGPTNLHYCLLLLPIEKSIQEITWLILFMNGHCRI